MSSCVRHDTSDARDALKGRTEGMVVKGASKSGCSICGGEDLRAGGTADVPSPILKDAAAMRFWAQPGPIAICNLTGSGTGFGVSLNQGGATIAVVGALVCVFDALAGAWWRPQRTKSRAFVASSGSTPTW